ncbi:hypothetical protein HU200_010592 [Digitaria exilis]|uniref:Uncharacterized protein n=1 Tax=Digitaria exilis TaxID=1010633 RepID=A0A835FI27_9POAL|nr:hypothetical protein HU200_010592 [Digitaria exilis]
MLSPPTVFPRNPKPSKLASNTTAPPRCHATPSGDAALCAFRAHHCAGRSLDANPSLIPALVACARLPAEAETEQIHALLVKCGRAVSDGRI